MGIAELEERRLLLEVDLHGVLVAGREGVALGRIDHVGRHAGNAHQLLGGLQVRHGSQQGTGIGMGGREEDLLRSALLHDLAGIHDVDAVGHVGHHAHVVGDEDNGQVPLPLDLVDEVQDLGLHRHVQCGGGLVADQYIRVAGQGDGDNDTLAHTAGELEGILVEAVVGIRDTDRLHQLHRTLSRILLAHVGIVQLQGLGDAFLYIWL